MYKSIKNFFSKKPQEPEESVEVLEAIEEDEDMWDAVVETYAKAGFGHEYAIDQARMAYILRKDQYEGLDKYPKLWYPSDEIIETA